MAFRRRTTQRRRPVRRPRYRRKTYSRRNARVPRRMLTEIPQSKYVKLKYCDVLAGTVVAGSYATWPFQTSCFDPYVSAGGHQPLGFDQWSTMFYSYRVMGMSYTITCQSTTIHSRLTCVAYANIDAYSITLLSSALERKYSRSATFGADRDGRMKGYVSVAKLWGLPLSVIKTEDNYSALVTANPVNLAYLNFSVYNPTAANAEVILNVQLNYFVEFYRPRSQAQS